MLTALLLTVVSASATGENRVRTKLVSNIETAVAGSTIMVGVLFDIPERAHIYWRNPGDSGLATDVAWEEIDAVTIGGLQWPAPRQFSVEGLDEAYFGYTDEVLLYSQIEIPKGAKPDSNLVFSAKVQWLLCQDDGVCIPEDQVLEVIIPIRTESRLAYESTLFSRYMASVPIILSKTDVANAIHWSFSTEGFFEVTLPKTWNLSVGQAPRFFPDTGGAWSMINEKKDGSGIKLRFRPVYKGDALTGGVLVLPFKAEDGTHNVRYIKVDTPDKP
jgi:DsbC/DsbD-like thiol-disulfide interchange protein